MTLDPDPHRYFCLDPDSHNTNVYPNVSTANTGLFTDFLMSVLWESNSQVDYCRSRDTNIYKQRLVTVSNATEGCCRN